MFLTANVALISHYDRESIPPPPHKVCQIIKINSASFSWLTMFIRTALIPNVHVSTLGHPSRSLLNCLVKFSQACGMDTRTTKVRV